MIGKAGRDISANAAYDYVAGYVRPLLLPPPADPHSTDRLRPLQTLAIDYTGRNVQDAVKAKGLPWSAAKVRSLLTLPFVRRVNLPMNLRTQGFDTFCPVGDFIPKEKIPDPHALKLWYKVRPAYLSLNSISGGTVERVTSLWCRSRRC